MNKLFTPTALEAALGERLRILLSEVPWLNEVSVEASGGPFWNYDLRVTLSLPGGAQAVLCVECKTELRPAAFPALAARKMEPPPGRPRVVVPVLALPAVSPRLAELCAAHGWSWFDLAGNCRLDVPGLLHLAHSGRESVHAAPRPVANLGTPEAARVIRALLATDHAARAWTQRDIQDHCRPGVSLGLVNKVVRHLRDEAFLEDTSDGFRVADPQKLLFVWRDAYRFDRHDRRAYFTLLQGKKLRDALARLDTLTGGHAAYAGFSAAEFQAPHVRQPKTWLYVRPHDLAAFAQTIEAKPVDSGENLIVLLPSDDGVFYLGEAGTMGEPRLGCTNAVQTYVDLWHSGGRGREAAEALLEQHLHPLWKRREVAP